MNPPDQTLTPLATPELEVIYWKERADIALGELNIANARIKELEGWHRTIVGLAAAWDELGVTVPRTPLSWESLGRMAMDYAAAALNLHAPTDP